MPWVMIVAIVQDIAVVAIALLALFSGRSVFCYARDGNAPSTMTGLSSSATVVKIMPAVIDTLVVTIKSITPVNAPQERVFVKVSYISGYWGKFWVNGVLKTVTGTAIVFTHECNRRYAAGFLPVTG